MTTQPAVGEAFEPYRAVLIGDNAPATPASAWVTRRTMPAMPADESRPPSVTNAIASDLLRTIVRAVQASRERALGATESLADGWHLAPYDPNALLGCFPHVGLKDGSRLASYQFKAGGNGNGLAVVVPIDRQLPPPRGDQTRLSSIADPGELPRWASRDVARYLRGDGTPLSYFEASLFLREVRELGALWHGCSWSTHEIVTAPSELPDSPRRWRGSRPEVLAPTVAEWDGGRKRVEFYTHTALGQSRVCRHRDNYKTTYRPRCSVTVVAEGPFGYVF